jgi:hypothetical protein
MVSELFSRHFKRFISAIDTSQDFCHLKNRFEDWIGMDLLRLTNLAVKDNLNDNVCVFKNRVVFISRLSCIAIAPLK